jgi:2-dehydro-3-deoxygalactonokinase
MQIFVDWGSTNFRAFLREDGRTVDRRQAAGGGTLKGFSGRDPAARAAEYSAFFVEQLRDWLARHPDASTYVCGAAGGREGWVETAYSEAPAGIEDVRRNLHKIAPAALGAAAGRNVYIASGCAIAFPDGRHDVMRSEEVKSLGAVAHLGLKDALLAIPGTHGKWVRIAGGKIVHFETALSGEVFGVMSEKGALAAVMRGEPPGMPPDLASFENGLALADEGFDLLTDIWQVRAQKLRASAPPASLRDYFSGILLGHELRQMQKFFPGKPPVVLLADPGAKRELYRRAFARAGWPLQAELDSETSVCAGLGALA